MKATAIALLIGVLVVALAAPCFAGQSHSYRTFAGGVKLALHIQPYNAKMNCGNLPTFTTRDDIVRMETGTGDYHVIAVVFDYGAGLTNVEYGLSWPGGWGSAATTHCGDLVIGGIVNPYDWISVSWAACKTEPAILPVAYTWLNASTAGQIQFEFRPAPPEPATLGIVDCDFGSVATDSIFFAGVDIDPWSGVPDTVSTEPTTWGEIKSMFR